MVLLASSVSVYVDCEQRYTFDRRMERSLYLIRVTLPPEAHVTRSDLEQVEAWARECIAERRFLSP